MLVELTNRPRRCRRHRDALLRRFDEFLADRTGSPAGGRGRERRALVRRRQRHDRPDGRVLGIGGVVVVLEKGVDHDATLRVRDQIDLAARVLALRPLELLGEAEAGTLQVAVRLIGSVCTTVCARTRST